MKQGKWQVEFAVINLVLAVIMCWIGQKQYERDHRMHPEYFYHGNLYYIPPAQIAIYSVDAPAYSASVAVQDLGIRHLPQLGAVFTSHVVFYVYPGFFVAGVALWWWIGAKLERPSGRLSKPSRRHPAKMLTLCLGVLLSLAMAYRGYLFRRGTEIPRPIPFSQMAWGLMLAPYFCSKVMRDVMAPQKMISSGPATPK